MDEAWPGPCLGASLAGSPGVLLPFALFEYLLRSSETQKGANPLVLSVPGISSL